MMDGSTMVWVDLETTGLDPVACDILEVGIVVTDGRGEVRAQQSWVVRRGNGRVDPWPLRTHVRSGLWGESEPTGKAMVQSWAQRDILRWLNEHTEPGRPMCGSSVHFDRAFLAESMPLVHGWFGYRNFDVSTLAEFATMAGATGVWPDGDSEHRALPDLMRSIGTFKRCLAWAKGRT